MQFPGPRAFSLGSLTQRRAMALIEDEDQSLSKPRRRGPHIPLCSEYLWLARTERGNLAS